MCNTIATDDCYTRDRGDFKFAHFWLLSNWYSFCRFTPKVVLDISLGRKPHCRKNAPTIPQAAAWQNLKHIPFSHVQKDTQNMFSGEVATRYIQKRIWHNCRMGRSRSLCDCTIWIQMIFLFVTRTNALLYLRAYLQKKHEGTKQTETAGGRNRTCHQK